MIHEITMPVDFLIAILDDETCPLCLGWLRGCAICPMCHADLGPVLDKVEELESGKEEAGRKRV